MTIYLEVVTSKYIPGTSNRDENEREFVPIEVTQFEFEEFKDAARIYGEAHGVLVGIQYTSSMVGGRNYKQTQKWATNLYVPSSSYPGLFCSHSLKYVSDDGLRFIGFGSEIYKFEGNKMVFVPYHMREIRYC